MFIMANAVHRKFGYKIYKIRGVCFISKKCLSFRMTSTQINNLEKTDPSEIERTFNRENSQSLFTKLLKNTPILTPPTYSTDISGILLSVRTYVHHS